MNIAFPDEEVLLKLAAFIISPPADAPEASLEERIAGSLLAMYEAGAEAAFEAVGIQLVIDNEVV